MALWVAGLIEVWGGFDWVWIRLVMLRKQCLKINDLAVAKAEAHFEAPLTLKLERLEVRL